MAIYQLKLQGVMLGIIIMDDYGHNDSRIWGSVVGILKLH